MRYAASLEQKEGLRGYKGSVGYWSASVARDVIERILFDEFVRELNR